MKSIPTEIGMLTNLKVLTIGKSMSSCALYFVVLCLQLFSYIIGTALFLTAMNQLESLPAEIGQLSALGGLDFRMCIYCF